MRESHLLKERIPVDTEKQKIKFIITNNFTPDEASRILKLKRQ